MRFRIWLEESELFKQKEKYLGLGKRYKGEPYPVGQEATELAAVAQGKKPAAILRMQLPGKSTRSEFGLLQKMLLGMGVKARPDFTIKKVRAFPQHVIVGNEKAVMEIDKLLSTQKQLCDISGGSAGFNCKRIHQRMGELLGYRAEEIEKFLAHIEKTAIQSGETWYQDIPQHLLKTPA